MNRFLQGITDKQLIRLQERIRERIYSREWSGDPYGWDVPTLWALRPGIAHARQTVINEVKRRLQARQETA